MEPYVGVISNAVRSRLHAAWALVTLQSLNPVLNDCVAAPSRSNSLERVSERASERLSVSAAA